MKYTDYLELKQKFEEQKRLAHYQKTRKLPRPRTTWLDLVGLVLLLFGMLFAMFAAARFFLPVPANILFLSVALFAVFEFYLRSSASKSWNATSTTQGKKRAGGVCACRPARNTPFCA